MLVPPCNPAADPLPFLDATENRRKNEGLLESGQDIPGSPKRPKGSPKNQPKIGLLTKKITPKQILCRFFVRKVLFVFLLQFCIDFRQKCGEESMKAVLCFSTASRVFFNWATLTIVGILRIESYFWIFCDLAFFPKKNQTFASGIENAIYVPKNTKK